MAHFLLRSSFCLMVSFFALPAFSQTPCDCVGSGNCPVPINDADTTTATLLVDVPGAPDLASCPLESVCVTISHTWIGDISVSLISPNGEHYLLIADAGNDYGNCGTQQDNLEVCITIGTGNPLTNNAEYQCNPAPCSLGTCCLNGNWTVPCGGVTDPITGALQAPNCDLNAFNLPGTPVNGVWTLVVSDVCNQDVGAIHNFSLNFGCSAASSGNGGCFADGGLLLTDDIVKCSGNFELDFETSPQFCTGAAPDSDIYSYAYVISRNDSILAFAPQLNLSTYPSDFYEIWGFSFLESEMGQLPMLIGTSLQATRALFVPGSYPFCGDFSGDNFFVEVTPSGPPCSTITIDAGPDAHLFCSEALTLQGFSSYAGSDVCTAYSWQLPDSSTIISQNLVLGPDAQTGTYIFSFKNNVLGCELSDTIEVSSALYPIAEAGQDTVLECWEPQFLLDASNSSAGDNFLYTWISQNGEFISNQLSISVAESGTYTLYVNDNTNGCTTFDQIDIVIPPSLIVGLNITPVTCDGTAGTASVVLQQGVTNAVYEWSTGDSTQSIGGLGQGAYSVTVSNGSCSYSQDFFIDEYLPAATNLEAEICEGDIYTFNGQDIGTPGTYQAVLVTSNGCDSIVTLNLEVKPEYATVVQAEITLGGSWNGILVFSDTIIIEQYTAINGCDSTVTVELSVLTATHTLTAPQFELLIFPNPFDANVSIGLRGFEPNKSLTFKLLDLTGSVIRQQKFLSPAINFQRGHIPPGLYFIKIEDERKLVGLGRVVAK